MLKLIILVVVACSARLCDSYYTPETVINWPRLECDLENIKLLANIDGNLAAAAAAAWWDDIARVKHTLTPHYFNEIVDVINDASVDNNLPREGLPVNDNFLLRFISDESTPVIIRDDEYIGNAYLNSTITRGGYYQLKGWMLRDDAKYKFYGAAEFLMDEPNALSIGNKTLLFIRVDFSDKIGAPITATAADRLLKASQTFFTRSAGGKMTLSKWAVLPTVRMPQTHAYYAQGNNYMSMLGDACNVIRSRGFDCTKYDFYSIYFSKLQPGWGGRGYVGAPGIWINGNAQPYVLCHEMGHNMGLWHANFIVSQETPPVSYGGRGVIEEYGDLYDLMGRSYDEKVFDYNLNEKQRLLWVNPPAEVAAGKYLLSPIDGNITSKDSPIYGFKIPYNAARTHWYYFSFRSRPVASEYIGGAVEVHMTYNIYDSVNSTHYLDTKPFGGGRDPIKLGNSFAASKYTVTFVAIDGGRAVVTVN